MKTGLGVVVAIEAVIASLRAGSRALYLFRNSGIGQIEGPHAALPLSVDDGIDFETWEVLSAFCRCLRRQRILSSEDRGLRQPAGGAKYGNMQSALVEANQNYTGQPIGAESFAALRPCFGISDVSFYQALLDSGPYVSFQSYSKGAARAKGLFFFTRDGSYMIKTIKHDEVQTLVKMLPEYRRYMSREGESSLLTKFCGLFEVNARDAEGKPKSVVFVVMNSVFPPETSQILERFDLKGSTLGRECSAKELEAKGSSAVMKDLDLLREIDLVSNLQNLRATTVQGHGFRVGEATRLSLLSQLKRDVSFLVACNVIDYSLLVGVALRRPTGDVGAAEFCNLHQSLGKERLVNVPGTQRTHVLREYTMNSVRFISLGLSGLSSDLWERLVDLVDLNSPYYGARECGVSQGKLGLVPGDRLGRRANFYFGIIDILQPFNEKKRLEWIFKKIIYGSGYSCIPPSQYAERFISMMEKALS